MDRELLIIDGILMNLAGIQSFYEFEHAHLSTLVHLSEKFQKETCEVEELQDSNEIFMKESGSEIEFLKEKIKSLEKKIEDIKVDISSRKESKLKLISLFDALKSVDSFEKRSSLTKTGNLSHSKLDADLPIMEIREDLDDNGDIIASEVKPYGSSNNELMYSLKGNLKDTEEISNTCNLKKEVIRSDSDHKTPLTTVGKLETNNNSKDSTEDQMLETSLSDSKDGSFLPFVIREEIDDDGNIIKSSMARIPKMKEEDSESENLNNANQDQNVTSVQNTEEIDEDQINELFEDMGFVSQEPEAKISEVVEKINNAEITKAPLNDTENVETGKSNSSIDTNDIYTLELIADELNQNEDEDIDEEYSDLIEQEIDDDFEWPEIDGGNNGDDSDDDDDEVEDYDENNIQERAFTNMFGSKGQNLFAQQLMNLRSKKSENASTDDIEIEEVKEIIQGPQLSEIVQEIKDFKEVKEISPSKFKKSKKSVSFKSTVDVKKVDDIWGDLRISNAENELNENNKNNTSTSTSVFKRGRATGMNEMPTPIEKNINTERENSNVISDIVERQITDSNPKSDAFHSHNIFKTFDSDKLRKQLDSNMSELADKKNMTKLSGKKAPSKFKMARAAEMGKKFQETHIPAEIREQLRSMSDNIALPKCEETKNNTSEPEKKLLKNNLKSLMPQKTKQELKSSHTIIAPKDINPLPVNPQISDEDYEIIRHEATDDIFEDDDDLPENEFITTGVMVTDEQIDNTSNLKDVTNNEAGKPGREYFPKYEKNNESKEGEVIGTTLDYRSLSDDMDTMAKAYVLGLYDDDLHTPGEIIEKLDDFERHNKIVEEKEASKLHERVTEINRQFEDPSGKIEEILEDDDPMVVSDIVENDMDDIMQVNAIPDEQLDIELNDDTLTTQVALDYTKIRSNMIHKYKGGFRETDKEKEFVRPEGSERVSRFKLARLGI